MYFPRATLHVFPFIFQTYLRRMRVILCATYVKTR